jgi:hypothetical protein
MWFIHSQWIFRHLPPADTAETNHSIRFNASNQTVGLPSRTLVLVLYAHTIRSIRSALFCYYYCRTHIHTPRWVNKNWYNESEHSCRYCPWGIVMSGSGACGTVGSSEWVEVTMNMSRPFHIILMILSFHMTTPHFLGHLQNAACSVVRTQLLLFVLSDGIRKNHRSDYLGASCFCICNFVCTRGNIWSGDNWWQLNAFMTTGICIPTVKTFYFNIPWCPPFPCAAHSNYIFCIMNELYLTVDHFAFFI